MIFEIGKTYGGYEFLDILKMSKVEIAYRVRNTLAHRLEVLTVLSGNLHAEHRQVERFLREIKVRARLVHPNIVAFYNAWELERQAVMTTELVEGTPLRDLLQLGPMHWVEAIDYMRQALSALACAHARRIVHRDITPENMIVTFDGVLKLSDFGLAKAEASLQLTQAGPVVGSPHYISPEQIRGSASLDGRGDLYSLGVVLYEALTGKKPFDSESQFELMLAHATQTPRPPSELNPDIPAELDGIVMTALAKDPAGRFQTADEFRSALESVRAGRENPPAPAPAMWVAASPVDLPPVETPAEAPPPLPAPAAQPVAPVDALAAPPVATQPVDEAAEAAPPLPVMFQAMSSAGSESRSLVATGLVAACIAVVLGLVYVFAGR